MPPVSVLIKPASSACSMNCGYCFYRDVAANRSEAFLGILPQETAERIIIRALEFAEGSCTFIFQGGEPTLAGLDFFKKFTELEKRHKKPGVRFFNSIQTNGYSIDENWAAFFAENDFLVGLSLDGFAGLHNHQRPDKSGSGTFNRAMNAARLMKKAGVQFNILCVVTGQTAACAQKLYNFYKKNDFRFLQFIPCLDPLCGERGGSEFSLSPEEYGEFLIRIFRLWLDDLKKGDYVSIRYFDNLIRMILGMHPEACGMSGRCCIQFVCEGNGNVYPCDFYVLDELLLGNVESMSFAEMASSENAKKFLRESVKIPSKCRECEFFGLCRNGCRRDRTEQNDESINYYCKSFKAFFSACLPGLYEAARIIGNQN